MNYNPDVYQKNQDDTARFTLGVRGNNPLIVVGINPSMACDKKSDRTISKVMKFAETNNFDGFVMINVYPLRSTKPYELPKEIDNELHKQNLSHIEALFKQFSNATILLAFGNNIDIRAYLRNCLSDIIKISEPYNSSWKHLGKLTAYGNPRHPLYVKISESLNNLDATKFIKQ